MKKIKELPQHDRPREKMREKGAAALTNEELVQVILGRGVEGHDVRSMSQKIARILEQRKGHLAEADLRDIRGVGEAKRYQLLAAFEIARRFTKSDSVRINGTEDVVPLLQDIAAKPQEHFVCISLNGANEVIEKRIVTVGLLDRSQVHPREVFADAIADRAAAVILAHNHPSGDIRPSDADLKMHNQLIEAAKILGLSVIDHIIIGKKGYFSFSKEGILN
ncbi:MAG: DNA repair protein RadC [Smithella sp.]|nr:DNA repair protein RadC [Smithella sp.]MDM7987870.1 DNA repair protein RadC [Smithella sp.]HOU50247.1 DNA repair protein RadC [Smithella sp.]HQG65244.1 DNA repair protein RadC [Smithella sp.]HQI72169.1 DNA repair protein RadC [Smithella sp.]